MQPLTDPWYLYYNLSEGLAKVNGQSTQIKLVRESGEDTYKLININPIGKDLILAQETIWRPTGGRFGVFKEDGTIIVPFVFKHIEYRPDEDFLICDDKTYGVHGELIAYDGESPIHLPSIYDDAHPCYSEGLVAVHRSWNIENPHDASDVIPELKMTMGELLGPDFPKERWLNGWGYVDKTGNEVIKCNNRFFLVGDFHNGLAWVKEPVDGLGHEFGKSIGYINKSGELICKVLDNYLGDFSEGVAIVGSGKPGEIFAKLRFIDEKGNSIIGKGFNDATPFRNGLASISFVYSYRSVYKKEYLIDINGRIKLASEDGDVWVSTDLFQYNYFSAYKEKYCVIGYVDCNRFSHQYGLMDRDGKIIVPVIYSRIDDFHEGKAIIHYNVPHLTLRVGSPFNEDVDYDNLGYNVFEGYFDKDLRIHTLVEDKSITLPEGSIYSFDLPWPFIAVRTMKGFGVYNVNDDSFVLPCIYDIVDYNRELIWAKKGQQGTFFTKEGVEIPTKPQ